jgi:hypothetical protein
MDNSKLLIDPNTGEVIANRNIEKIKDINEKFFVTYQTNPKGEICESSIFKTPVTHIISIPY